VRAQEAKLTSVNCMQSILMHTFLCKIKVRADTKTPPFQQQLLMVHSQRSMTHIILDNKNISTHDTFDRVIQDASHVMKSWMCYMDSLHPGLLHFSLNRVLTFVSQV
jgi:hypothetical protein